MHILLIEDDWLQARQIADRLARDLDAHVTVADSESAFRQHIARVWSGRPRPDVVVLDLMLAWDAGEGATPAPPPEVITDGNQKAGLRCLAYLREHDTTVAVPTILYTVMPEAETALQLRAANLEKHTLVCRKTPDDLYLSQSVRSMLAAVGGLATSRPRPEKDVPMAPGVNIVFAGPTTVRDSQIAASMGAIGQLRSDESRSFPDLVDELGEALDKWDDADHADTAEELRQLVVQSKHALATGEEEAVVEQRLANRARTVLKNASFAIGTSTAARAVWELLAVVVK